MNKKWVLTPELFEALLAWLDPNREVAGEKYEDIRRGLIKIFTSNGCHTAEDLADEAINRVANRVDEIKTTYEGDPALYFYGVAKKLVKEDRRKPPVKPPIPTWTSDDIEPEYLCLESCLQQLTSEHQYLVLQYYQEERRAKIDHRRKLAEKLGIALNALRIRAYRIRSSLEACVRTCLLSSEGEIN